MDNLILTIVFIIVPVVLGFAFIKLCILDNKKRLEALRRRFENNEKKLFFSIVIYFSVILFYLLALVAKFVGFDLKVHAFIITCLVLISTILLISYEYGIDRLVKNHKTISKILFSSLYFIFLTILYPREKLVKSSMTVNNFLFYNMTSRLKIEDK